MCTFWGKRHQQPLAPSQARAGFITYAVNKGLITLQRGGITFKVAKACRDTVSASVSRSGQPGRAFPITDMGLGLRPASPSGSATTLLELPLFPLVGGVRTLPLLGVVVRSQLAVLSTGGVYGTVPLDCEEDGAVGEASARRGGVRRL